MSRAVPGGPAGFARLAEVLGRVVIPAAAGLALVSIVVGGHWGLDRELHLIAAEQAPAGSWLPIRAHLYAGLNRPEGPALEPASIRVELRDRQQRVLAATTLSSGHRGTLEGGLRLPANLAPHSGLRLRAQTTAEEPPVHVERSLHVAAPAPSEPPRPRALGRLSRLAAGPPRSRAGAVAPVPLRARVGGGACVPEQPCEIFVHVGDPPAAVHLLPSASVVPGSGSARPSRETRGVVKLLVSTRGTEAQATLIATRGGQEVARRGLRLPVALAADAIPPGPRVVRAAEALKLGLAGPERGCIADLFVDGRWRHSVSLRTCRGQEQLPLEGVVPGTLRVQLRRDPFSPGSAAVRIVYRRGPAETPAEALAALASAARRRAPDDLLAARSLISQDLPAGSEPPEAGYLAALLEAGIVQLPPAASSHPAAVAELLARRARVQSLAVWVVAMCGLLLALLLLQRGLRAGAEAGRIMGDAGEQPEALHRQHLRMLVRVVAVALSLLLAFTAIAMYVIARADGP